MLEDVKSALSILDQVKEWKILKTLPEKVKELEDRIAKLEEKPRSPYSCPSCGSSEYPIIKERPDPYRGKKGYMLVTRICHNCHRQFERSENSQYNDSPPIRD